MSQLDRTLAGATPGRDTSPAGTYLQTGVVRGIRAPWTIQVRLSSDRFLPDSDLGWCTPLLPTGVLPMLDELVRVFVPDPSQPQAERYWVGPVFTDWGYGKGQVWPGQNFSLTDNAWSQLNGGPTAYPSSDSRYPHLERPQRVHTLTRGGTDSVFADEQVFLRAARHNWETPAQPNADNPGLIGLSSDARTRGTTALVQAERIALLTQAVAAKDPLLPTSGEIEAAAAAAHPLAFADVLAQQLEVLRQALVEHLHPGPGKAPITDDTMRALRALDFTKLGSDSLVGS